MNANAEGTQAVPAPRSKSYSSMAVLLSLLAVILISACAQTGAAQGEELSPAAPESCPVTTPPAASFVPPSPFPEAPGAGQSWYGSPALWTVIPKNGIWEALPQSEDGYGQKLFWWSKDYSPAEETPIFDVIGKKFDEPAFTANNAGATNGSHTELGSFIVAGIELPEAGCWVITGSYRGESLSYTVWVVGSDGK